MPTLSRIELGDSFDEAVNGILVDRSLPACLTHASGERRIGNQFDHSLGEQFGPIGFD
jgi:hypothetical protein